jgi:hypothetical protein
LNSGLCKLSSGFPFCVGFFQEKVKPVWDKEVGLRVIYPQCCPNSVLGSQPEMALTLYTLSLSLIRPLTLHKPLPISGPYFPNLHDKVVGMHGKVFWASHPALSKRRWPFLLKT